MTSFFRKFAFTASAVYSSTQKAVVVTLTALLLSGCVANLALDELSSAPPAIPAKVLQEMANKGMSPEDPVLVRIFKQESELEIWKMNKAGRFALLKTYPMCRWSGKLGPKKKSGDRQAPEGFYHVSAGMLNPKSQYFVSFNLGYPNRLEAALGYSGEALMVHGACSSSGCYALTDQGVGEIYAIVAKALASGQERFQVQAYPFRMSAENIAAHAGDENMQFWRVLKDGYDSFVLTKQPPKVSACGARYRFNMEYDGGEPRDPLAACPPGRSMADATLQAQLADEQKKVDKAIADGGSPSVLAYLDGGMHSTFRAFLKKQGAGELAKRVSGIQYPVSRPEAALADPFEPLPRRPAQSQALRQN